jgi:hypothetical protein
MQPNPSIAKIASDTIPFPIEFVRNLVLIKLFPWRDPVIASCPS